MRRLIHCPYNYHTDLHPTGSIPFGCTYLLLEPKIKAIWDYLAKGFIQSSKSPVGAPISFVRNHGTLHLCVDCALNSITIKTKYYPPFINELLEWVSIAKVFTKLEPHSVHNLVHIQESNEWKIAFHSRYGHYEY